MMMPRKKERSPPKGMNRLRLHTGSVLRLIDFWRLESNKEAAEKAFLLRGLAPKVRVLGSEATRDGPFAPALVAQI